MAEGLREQAGRGLDDLLTGLDDGEIDAADARRVVVDLLDALIPSGPFEGLERKLLETAVGGIADLVARTRRARGPERLRRRAARLRERAERLERRADEG